VSTSQTTAVRWANAGIGLGLAVFLLSLFLTGETPDTGTDTAALGPTAIPPPLYIPADNPQTPEKAELGRYLFYDTRLSFNETIACASCHQQDKAFTDGRRFSPGATGELTRRNAMSLTNVGYNATLTWANDGITRLEQQALIPLAGVHPLEMGITGHEAEVLQRLHTHPVYRDLFAAAFGNDADPVTLDNVTRALAAFQRTFLSYDSPYDRYMSGDPSALSARARAGLDLFFSDRIGCSRCHGGHNFRFTPGHRRDQNDPSVAFHNTGLYNLDGHGAYPPDDQGLIETSGNPADMGKFKAPTLRNIALTAPYMHDGSIGTLSEVLSHYARGGRLITAGPNAGDGSLNPLKSREITGFELTAEEEAALLAFLESLTDSAFIANRAFANPWTGETGHVATP